ncbi:MAG: RNA polymerase subunit sigma-24 [Xanthomonadales bacterium]|nr:RNA polymerase subunit sigma-24 [Xanthomonadales bacterium]
MANPDVQRALQTIWRMEAPRLLARIARIVGDVALAEELAQDVFVRALERWPRDGLPDQPAAWLTAVGKRLAIDHLRARAVHARKQGELAQELLGTQDAEWGSTNTTPVEAAEHAALGDELLRLIFVACHPVLAIDARVALTLRLLGGLTTAEIARAFLQPEATVAQRIVRAKRTLSEKRIPFEVPAHAALDERVDAVLEVLYLIFNEGYSASSGTSWARPALCEEALRLGRVLAAQMKDSAEVFGLLALMELQASRLPARLDASGRPVLLERQDRSRWDRLQITRGLQALQRAQRLQDAPGIYTLQAAIAACHAQARRAADTDWRHIAALYALLETLIASPVVALNRAVAIGRANGPAAALPLVEALNRDARMQQYPWAAAAYGDLLQQLGRRDEARRAFERAAALAGNEHDRLLMRERADAV